MTKITFKDGVFDKKVGDEVFVTKWRLDSPPTISKIGQKYFYITHYGRDIKFDIETGVEHFGPRDCGTQRSCYSSKEAYDNECDLYSKIETIKNDVKLWNSYNIVEHQDKINKIYDILFKE